MILQQTFSKGTLDRHYDITYNDFTYKNFSYNDDT